MGVPVFKRAGDPADPAVLLVHGYPASSHMWRPALEALAARGLYALAPDLPGFGDSPPGPGGTNTWTRHVETLEALRQSQELERVALVGHDWGGLIGLRWACEHPDAVEALVISASGFFPDGKWHGMADAMRTPGQGEELVASIHREGFGQMLSGLSPGIGNDAIDEYWKAFADETRRRAQLEFYRSMDFEKIAPYEGRLADLGVPTLLIFGEEDPFCRVATAHRFERELPDTELVVLAGTGHFLWEDEPERCAAAARAFLAARL